MIIKAIMVSLLLALAATPTYAATPVREGAHTSKDCLSKAYCAIDIDFTAQQAAQRLGKKTLTYWIDGNTVRVAARTDDNDDAPMLCCTFQDPMEPLGADAHGKLWGRVYKVSGLDKAIISMILLGQSTDYQTYRGAHAPPAPQLTNRLDGKVETVTVHSTYLKADRQIVIYTPAAPPPETGYPVVYMGDGKAVNFDAHMIDQLIRDGKIRPILLVGIAGGEGPPLADGGLDQRNREYLINRAPDDYLAHEAFVLKEVMPLAETRYHASQRAADRMVQGTSAGASWALSFALRHHDLVDQAAAFSVSIPANAFDFSQAKGLRLYLEAGRYEDERFRPATLAACKAAKAVGAHCRFIDLYAGHDSEAWNYAFVETLKQVFKP